MPTYKCKQGQHAFAPPVSLNINHRPERIGWFVNFPESWAYDLGNANQFDWCKVAGESFNLFTNHRDSGMFGGRFNLDEKLVELNAYCHVSGRRVMGDPVFSVGLKSTVALWMEIDYNLPAVWFYFQKRDAGWISYRVHFDRIAPFLGLCREIGAWFGGDETAPHDMEIWKERVWKWKEEGGKLVPDWTQLT